MSRISIILPVYNGEQFLEECVQSVLAQSETDFELLIGDDGSSDRSRAMLAALDDPRVTVIMNPRNLGLFGNLNQLLAKATSPLVRFLCQDDALHSHCLADEIAYFAANEKIVMTICAVDEIDDQGRVVGEWAIGDGPSVFDGQWCLQKLYYEGCIAGNLSTVCVRRWALEAAGPFDTSYQVAGDYEMWVRVCRHGWVADRQGKLIRLRQHQGRLSEAAFSGVKFARENRRILEQIWPLLPVRIQAKAKRFTWWSQNVFDTNHFIRCLLAGKFAECRALFQVMGWKYLLPGLAAWLLTVNNRLYRPKPTFYKKPA